MATIADLDDVQLYERWEWEKLQEERPPNDVLVASLEREAKRRGFRMRDVIESIGLQAARVFDPDLHPRGHDGKFIEKLGWIELLDFNFKAKNGKTYGMNGRRGQVTDITPDPKNPGHPTIKVRIDDPKTGKPTMFVDVKPENIQAAPSVKARIPQHNESLPQIQARDLKSGDRVRLNDGSEGVVTGPLGDGVGVRDVDGKNRSVGPDDTVALLPKTPVAPVSDVPAERQRAPYDEGYSIGLSGEPLPQELRDDPDRMLGWLDGREQLTGNVAANEEDFTPERPPERALVTGEEIKLTEGPAPLFTENKWGVVYYDWDGAQKTQEFDTPREREAWINENKMPGPNGETPEIEEISSFHNPPMAPDEGPRIRQDPRFAGRRLDPFGDLTAQPGAEGAPETQFTPQGVFTQPAPEGGKPIAIHPERGELWDAQDVANAERYDELVKQGYNKQQANSIINSGYVLPELVTPDMPDTRGVDEFGNTPEGEAAAEEALRLAEAPEPELPGVSMPELPEGLEETDEGTILTEPPNVEDFVDPQWMGGTSGYQRERYADFFDEFRDDDELDLYDEEAMADTLAGYELDEGDLEKLQEIDQVAQAHGMSAADYVSVTNSIENLGWAQKEQLTGITFDGQPLEDQNPNALRNIADVLIDAPNEDLNVLGGTLRDYLDMPEPAEVEAPTPEAPTPDVTPDTGAPSGGSLDDVIQAEVDDGALSTDEQKRWLDRVNAARDRVKNASDTSDLKRNQEVVFTDVDGSEKLLKITTNTKGGISGHTIDPRGVAFEESLGYALKNEDLGFGGERGGELADIVPATERLDHQAALREYGDKWDEDVSDIISVLDIDSEGGDETIVDDVVSAMDNVDTAIRGGRRDEMTSAYDDLDAALERVGNEVFTSDADDADAMVERIDEIRAQVADQRASIAPEGAPEASTPGAPDNSDVYFDEEAGLFKEMATGRELTGAETDDRGLDTRFPPADMDTSPGAGAPEVPAAAEAPSAANGWLPTAKSGDKDVPISQLPVGAYVFGFGTDKGNRRQVLTPTLIDGGDPNNPDDYRFRYRDSAGQSDWVQGDTTFDVASVPADKKLHKNSQRYLDLSAPAAGASEGGGGGTAAEMAAKGASVEGDQVVGPPGDYQGSTVKLLDGADSPIGTRVTSVKDGKTGEVVGYDKNDGYVKVKYDGDPKTYARSKRTLKAEAPTPAAAPLAPEPAPAAPAAPAASAPRTVANVDAELADVNDQLAGFNQGAVQRGELGPAAQANYTRLTQRRSALNQERSRLQTQEKQALASTPSTPGRPRSWTDPVIVEKLRQTQQAFNEEGVQYSVTELMDVRRDRLGEYIADARQFGDDTITIKPPSGVEQQIPLDVAEAWAAANGVKIPKP